MFVYKHDQMKLKLVSKGNDGRLFMMGPGSPAFFPVEVLDPHAVEAVGLEVLASVKCLSTNWWWLEQVVLRKVH
jgi:hypothetical protein